MNNLEEKIIRDIKEGNWREVIESSNTLLQHDSEYTKGYLYKALAFRNLDNHQAAIQCFKMAEIKGWNYKDDTNFYSEKAKSQMELGNFDEANNIFEEIIDFEGELPSNLEAIASCYDVTDKGRANLYWEKLRKLDPNNSSLKEHDRKNINKGDKKRKNVNNKGFLKIIASVAVIVLMFLGGKELLSNRQKDDSSDEAAKSGNNLYIEDNENVTVYINEDEKPPKKDTANIEKPKPLMKTGDELNNRIRKSVNDYLGSNARYFSIAFKDTASQNAMIMNDRSFNAASVIKIYIMAEVYNQINQGILNEHTSISISDNMKVGGSGVIANRKGIQSYTIRELIEHMIIDSDNTAANILIDMVGRDSINNLAWEKGLVNTNISRKMMDTDAIDAGVINIVSATDLLKTFEMLESGRFISKEYDEKMITVMKKQSTRSKIPAKLPRSIEVANKTGELGHIENDAGIIYTEKGNYMLVILLEGPMGNKRELVANISKIIYDEYINYNG